MRENGLFTRSVIALLLMSIMLSCVACARPKGADAGQATKRKAIENYISNTAAIHVAEQKAYRCEAAAHAETLFNQGMEQMKRGAGPDGKVSAAEAAVFIHGVLKDRDAYNAAADTKVSEIQVLIAEADKDIFTALKLDDLLEAFNEAGVDPGFVETAVNQVLQIVRGVTVTKKK